MKYKRNIKKKLEEALSRSPVVLLIGARQTGKTTLMKQIAEEKGYDYLTFDDLSVLAAAESDVQGFIKNLPKPIILDEVQRVPEIFLAIKKEVDDNRAPGLFCLTGSANPLLIPRLSDSLVGRMEILELFPLSQGELLNQEEVFIDHLFNDQDFGNKLTTREDLHRKIIIGGYPLVQNVTQEERDAWFNSYITTILYREVKDLTNIAGLSEFTRLLRLLAIRISTLLNISELSRSSGIASTTLTRYLSLLQAIFILYLQLPWSSNLSKRLIKSPKVSLIDSGLISFLLNIEIYKNISPLIPMGNILENFVLNELKKQASWCKTKVNLYHFRTTTGIEVDIILEDKKGEVIAIEVKHSDTISVRDFKGIKHLKEGLKDKFKQGIVLYTGSQIIPFSNGLKAIPVNALWNTV